MIAAGAVTVEGVARDHPEWDRWLHLCVVARRAATAPMWSAMVPDAPGGDGVQQPLIDGVVLRVDARAVSRVVGALLGAAGAPALGPDTAVRALAAAVGHDEPELAAIAEAGGIAPDLLRALGPLIAFPWLQACARAWGTRISATWQTGVCPVCGAWASLVEALGVDRALRLRCARCGADWPAAPVRCPFCGEHDHTRLSALVGDGSAEARRVEACTSCHGYMKTITRLTASPPLDVILLDLVTVDLDLAALEHGYARPAAAPRRVFTSVTPPRGRLRALFGAP